MLPVLVAGALICLSRFPIEQLKIDKSFTAELGGYQGAKRDDPDQLERVREPGCDYAQGFLFARRMDAFRATSLINAGATIGSLTAKAS